MRVSYYPKSRQIYGYLCSWVYNTSLEDEFSIEDESPLQDSYNMSKLYFKNVFCNLCQKYGKPTWYIDRLIYTYPLIMAQKFNTPLLVYGENVLLSLYMS